MRIILFIWIFLSCLNANYILDVDESKHINIIKKIFFLDNETKLLTLGDRTIRLWDIQSQTLLKTYHLYSPTINSGFIHDATLSNDKKTLYVGGFLDEDKNYKSVGDVYVIDTTTLNIKKILKGHKNSILSLALSPDGSKLASIDAQNFVLIRDTKTYETLKKIDLTNHKTRDSKLIKITNSSFDKENNLWLSGVGLLNNIANAHIIKVSKNSYKIKSYRGFSEGANTHKIEAIDENTLLIFGTKSTTPLLNGSVLLGKNQVILRDYSTQKNIYSFNYTNRFDGSFCTNKDKTKLFITNYNKPQANNLIHLKDKYEKTFKINFPAYECSFSEKGLLAVANVNGNIHLFDEKNPSKEFIFGQKNYAKEIQAVGIKEHELYIGNNKEQLLGDPTMFDEYPFSYKFKSFSKLSKNFNDRDVFRAFDRIGKLFIEPQGGTRADRNLLVYYDGKLHKTIKRDKYNGNFHTAATLVPNELIVVSGAATGEISVYELRLGQKIHSFIGHTSSINTLAVSKDGEYLVSGAKDKTVKIWSLKNIKSLLKNQEPQKQLIEQDLKYYKDSYKKMGYKKSFEDMVRFRQDLGLPLSMNPPSSKPLATLFISGDEWIIWNEDGYYISSSLGDEKIGWIVNNSKNKWSTWVGANQFERALYHPKLISEWIISHGDDNVYKKYKLDKYALTKLLKNPPAKANIISPKTATNVYDDGTHIFFSLNNKVDSYTLFVNDIPIFHEENPKQKKYKKYIPLFEKFNNIHIETISNNSMAKSKLFIKSDTSNSPKGDLYILSVGVKNFTHLKNKNLQYTTNDALAISKLFESQKENYNYIYTKILTDEKLLKPTKANILDSLSFLKNVEANDTVILFLASHGVSDANGEYYFLPQDAKESDLLKLSDPNAKIDSLVPWGAFFNTLRSTLGKRILIVDTCESKNISGTYELYSLIKRSSSSKFAIVTASKGDEYSQEYSQRKHGLFTYGLLEAFKGNGDINQDKSVTLKEAFEYASNIVKEKHDKRYGSQTPQISGAKSLFDTKLVHINK